MLWNYSDSFTGDELSDAWGANGAYPTHTISSGRGDHGFATSSESDGYTESIYSETIAIDTTSQYSIKILINLTHGDFRGEYGFRIYNSGKTNYIQCDIDLDQDSSEFDGSITIDQGGDSETFSFDYTGESSIFNNNARGWLDFRVNGTNIKLYWRGTQIVSETATKLSDDYSTFSITSTCSDSSSDCRIGAVEFNATISQNVGNTPPGGGDDGLSAQSGYRTMLISSCDGNFYRESQYGELSQLETDLTLRSDTIFSAAQNGQKLYIADFGDLKVDGSDGTLSSGALTATAISDWNSLSIDSDDDVVVISEGTGDTTDGTYTIDSVASDGVTLSSDPGDGTCSYRIERGPKVFDPIEDTLTLWTADSGQVPTGCPLVVNYLDRVVLAGADDNPHVWYMSAVSDPDDWDYSQTEVTSAVAGTSSNLGMPGRPITALAVNRDDYLIISTRDELWLMRGDPGYEGSFNNLTRNAGIISQNAWCLTPENQMVFLSTYGLYLLSVAGSDFQVQPLSRNIIPEELININVELFYISLAYDFENDGIHIFVVAKNHDGRKHWYIDWPTKTFWKMSYDEDREPLVIHDYHCAIFGHGGLLLGCRDGYVRHFQSDSFTDEDDSFSSYVYIGPIGLSQDGMYGKVISMETTISGESSIVDWELIPASTFAGTIDASASDSGSWSDGLNARNYVSCKGQAFILKVSGDEESEWSMEDVIMVTRDAGRRRLS